MNPRELAGDQDGIVSSVSGGLDLVSTRMTTPAEFSPDLLNVEILIDGTVAKRRGARRELNFSNFSNQYPNSFFSFNTLSGFPITLSTVNRALFATFCPEDNYLNQNPQPLGSVVRTNVFRSAGLVDFTVLREPNSLTRVVMTQKETTPIQFTVVESDATVGVDPVGAIPALILRGRAFAGISVGYTSYPFFVIYTSGVPWVGNRLVRYDSVNKIAYIAITSLTDITNAGVVLANVQLKVIYHTTQYWTESLKFEGTQFVANAVRGTVNPQDRVVAVPPQLLTDIASIGTPTAFPSYPLQVRPTPTLASTFAFGNPPATAGTYTYTNNGAYLSGGAAFVRSPFWTVFGGVPGTPETVLFTRGYSIPFLGDIESYDTSVTPLPYVYEVSGNDSSPSKWVFCPHHLSPPATSVRFSTRSAANYSLNIAAWKYLSLDGSDMNLVSTDSQYIVINPYPSGNAGAYFTPGIASNLANFPVEGQAWSAFGISSYSDYSTQSHPGVSALWQGRLVLAGWKDDPLRVVVSGVEDSAIVGSFWSDFQVIYNTPNSESAYDLVLPALNDDFITAVREFQGSLFIFTRDRLFRLVSQNDQISVRLVSNIGASNAACVTELDGTTVFMGAQGVHVIEPTRDEFDYTTRELSGTISTAFDNQSTEYGWLAYNQEYGYLFAGFGNYKDTWREKFPSASSSPHQYCTTTQLFVFTVRQTAWAKWADQSGTSFDICGACSVRRSDKTNTLMFSRAYRGDPGRQASQSLDWCLWEWGINELYAETYIYSPGSALIPPLNRFYTPVYGVSTLLEAAETEYFLDRSGTRQLPSDGGALLGGFGTCSVRDIEDIAIYSGGNPPSATAYRLTFGTDYYKTEHNSIVFANDFASLNTVYIFYGRNNPEFQAFVRPWGALVDGLPLNDGTDSTIVGGYYTKATGIPTTKIELLEFYPSWYSSPYWYREGVGYKKKAITYMGYYDNEGAGGWYTRYNKGANDNAIIGNRVAQNSFDLAVTFSDSDEGYYETEVYGSDDMLWDFSSLDLGAPSLQSKPYSRIALPIIGSGYNFQVWNYNYGKETFRLVGYELRTKAKRARGTQNTIE